MTNKFLANKYAACITLSIHQQLSQKGLLLGRFVLYVIIVYLFHQVFQSVGAPIERTWYLALTECFILSTPPIAHQIAEDCNNGQIVYFMLRPIHYLSLRFCESLGGIFIRFILLGITGFILGLLLTSKIPQTFAVWTLGIFFGIFGILLYTLISILIGLFAFWLKDIKTLIYFNLTATFCFGGLIVPLEFYSGSFFKICLLTPYAWVLWWPAATITEGPISHSLTYAYVMFPFWILFILFLIRVTYQKALRTLVVEGG